MTLFLASFVTSTEAHVSGRIAPVLFYGNVTLNGAPALAGTTIDGKFNESIVTDVEGQYYKLYVRGIESEENEAITFAASEIATWHATSIPESRDLDLSAADDKPPMVTNPDATPLRTLADSTAAGSWLNTAVIEVHVCDIESATVDLSAICGSDVQAIGCIDGDAYSTTFAVPAVTETGTYHLQVNADGGFEYSNAGVCIGLEVDRRAAKDRRCDTSCRRCGLSAQI